MTAAIDISMVTEHGEVVSSPGANASPDTATGFCWRQRGLAIARQFFSDSTDPAQARRRPWPATAVAACTWLYLAAVLAVWLLLRLGGDRWWFATVILFGPRWLCAVPLAVLAPAAVLVRRRLLWVLAAAAIVVFGPVMGFCIPWGRLAPSRGPTIRVLTCNLKGHCNNPALDELIERARPDIVALQDCWGEFQIHWPAGWHVWQEGELVIASAYPLHHENQDHYWQRTRHWPRNDVLACTVHLPGRDVDFYSVHLESPHKGLSAVLDRRAALRRPKGVTLTAEIHDRWRESAEAREAVAGYSESPILAGDFNLPADSAIYRRYWSGYRDAFSEVGLGFGYTEWPQVRWLPFGIRIDHVLTGPGWRCRRCWVGPDVGSDHLPLLAELSLPPAN